MHADEILIRLESKFDAYQDRTAEILADLTTLVKNHGLTLHGEPPKHEGLVLRFDRLEQVHKRRTWLQKTAGYAAIVAFFGWLANFIKWAFQ